MSLDRLLDEHEVSPQTIGVPCVTCGDDVEVPPEQISRTQPSAVKHKDCPNPGGRGLQNRRVAPEDQPPVKHTEPEGPDPNGGVY